MPTGTGRDLPSNEFAPFLRFLAIQDCNFTSFNGWHPSDALVQLTINCPSFTNFNGFPSNLNNIKELNLTYCSISSFEGMHCEMPLLAHLHLDYTFFRDFTFLRTFHHNSGKIPVLHQCQPKSNLFMGSDGHLGTQDVMNDNFFFVSIGHLPQLRSMEGLDPSCMRRLFKEHHHFVRGHKIQFPPLFRQLADDVTGMGKDLGISPPMPTDETEEARENLEAIFERHLDEMVANYKHSLAELLALLIDFYDHSKISPQSSFPPINWPPNLSVYETQRIRHELEDDQRRQLSKDLGLHDTKALNNLFDLWDANIEIGRLEEIKKKHLEKINAIYSYIEAIEAIYDEEEEEMGLNK
ncbi:MAG: hypothetical protein E4G98_07325 [Promethearchaeota archaeon]|nr:MAG: hypothetical protein E4G98_07325 [Candidatus Lokiarchaeota archaeon]